MNHFHLLDWCTLFGYLLLITVIACYCSRSNTSTEAYFVGNRSFSGWLIGLSLVGTSISSITFLAYPADAFKTSWIRFLPNLALPIALWVAGRYFLKFYRNSTTITAYQFLESSFGPSIKFYAAGVFIITQLFRISIILYLLSLVIYQMFGLNPVHSIIIGGVFIAFYTVIGGIEAVVWTDVLQTIVLSFGGVICLLIIIQDLPGGLHEVVSTAITQGKLSFAELKQGELVAIDWGFSLHNKTVILLLLVGLTAWLTEYSSNQNTIQRFCAARSNSEAKKGMWVCACFSLPIWAFFMFLGTALFVYFNHFPTPETTEIISGARKAEQILPFFIIHYLPPGIMGLVIVAALAAAMSSLDSSINAIATVTVTDIYKRHIKPDRSDRHYLHIAWIIASVTAVLMIIGAIILSQSETKTIQDTAMIITSLLSGGLLGLYLIAFMTNKYNKINNKLHRIDSIKNKSVATQIYAVWFGLSVTVCFTLWTVLSKYNILLPDHLKYSFDLYYTGLLGNVIMFVISFITWKSTQVYLLFRSRMQ